VVHSDPQFLALFDMPVAIEFYLNNKEETECHQCKYTQICLTNAKPLQRSTAHVSNTASSCLCCVVSGVCAALLLRPTFRRRDCLMPTVEPSMCPTSDGPIWNRISVSHLKALRLKIRIFKAKLKSRIEYERQNLKASRTKCWMKFHFPIITN